MRRPALLLILLASAAMAAPRAGAADALSDAQAPVSVSGAWARATLPGQDDGVAYMTLRSPAGDSLMGVESDQAQGAMLHQSTSTGGMAGMADVNSVPLPLGKAVALAPNGLHIMLMGLKHRLKAGDTLHLTLHFARAADQTVDVPVRPVAAVGP
jgi:copper(I)-binding protein